METINSNKPSRKPFLYATERAVHTECGPLYVPFSSLSDCENEVRQDKQAKLSPGVIYVRYTRVKHMEKAMRELERELVIKQNEARARLAEIVQLKNEANELRRETQGTSYASWR